MAVTGSLVGSNIVGNKGFAVVPSPFGCTVGLVKVYIADIDLLHAPIADRQGNVTFNVPVLGGGAGEHWLPRGVRWQLSSGWSIASGRSRNWCGPPPTGSWR